MNAHLALTQYLVAAAVSVKGWPDQFEQLIRTHNIEMLAHEGVANTFLYYVEQHLNLLK